MFLDKFGYIGETTLQNIKKGEVRNPYHKNSFGGYNGPYTEYNAKEYKWLRNIWSSMLTRVAGKRAEYSMNTRAYLSVKAYENVIMSPSWYCFANFASWYMSWYKNFNHEFEYNVERFIVSILFSIYKWKKMLFCIYMCTTN